jgi:hypothetical protein
VRFALEVLGGAVEVVQRGGEPVLRGGDEREVREHGGGLPVIVSLVGRFEREAVVRPGGHRDLQV